MQYQTASDATIDVPAPLTRDALRSLEWLALGLLVVAALALRLYNLGSFPDTLLADEADNAQDSVRILYGQQPANGFFGVDWTSQPAFSIYKGAAFMALFGFTMTAIRLPSALIGALALIPFYLLLRRQLSVTASLLAAALLGTSVWYLNFSRSGWNIVDLCFFMPMAMLFLLRGMDSLAPETPPHRRGIDFVISGFFCALALYGYPAGRAVVVALGLYLPLALYFYHARACQVLLGYIVLITVTALLFIPQALYALLNWEHFNGRTGVVFLLNNPDYQADPRGTLLHQFSWNLRGPWDGRVNNTPQYSPAGEPQLDRLSGILVLTGMALTLLLARLRRQPETWLWWLMLLSIWFFTQILTANTPNGARGLAYVPALYYFAAAGLDSLVRLIHYIFDRLSLSPARAGVFKHAAVLLFVAFVAVGGYANVKHYIDWQSSPQTRQARYLYVTAREFPAWAAAIENLAKTNGSKMNVGQWREVHPIADIADPH
jgi:4-amino-4-deoxy-L-arabinose transferase-like glycosyltransferase